jgi:putative transposase
MSEKYKTHSDGLYFVSFSVVGWLDIFTRKEYQDILIDSITFCQAKKNLKIYCYCIMPSHVHFTFVCKNGKCFTAGVFVVIFSDSRWSIKKA